MSLGLSVGRLALGNKTLFEQAMSILRRPGITANVYQAGAGGVRVNTLQTGNYILSDGSTGFSAVDGPTGLVLDGAGSVGSELVTNASTWSPPSGVTVDVGLSTASFGGAQGAYAAMLISPSVVVGKTYLVTYTVSGIVQGGVQVKCGDASLGYQSANGTYTSYLVAVATTGAVVQDDGGIGVRAIATVSNISVKQVTGIHATQATTANKPTVRRGLLNRQNYSNDLTNAGWTGANTTKAAGTLTRASAVASCFTNSPSFTTNFAVGEKITAYALVKAKSVGNRFGLRPTGTYPDRLDAVFDLASGAVVGSNAGGSFTGVSASIAGPDANGYYLCAVNGTVGGTACFSIVCGPTDSSLSVAGWEGTSAILSDVFLAGMGISSGLLTAQQVLDSGGIPLTTSAAASNPSAGRYSWSFDGGDSLALGSVPFQMADDWAIVAAANASVNNSTFFSIGNSAANVATIALDINTNNARLFIRDDAATLPACSGVANVVGAPHVFSAKKITNAKSLRVDGVQVATDSTAMGASTLNASGIGFLNRLTPANYMTGNISIVIAIKGTLSDDDMLTLERFAASTLPNAPAF